MYNYKAKQSMALRVETYDERVDDLLHRFCVQIPFTRDVPPLGNSYPMALSQFHQLERKLAFNSQLRQKYEQLSHMHSIQHHSSDLCLAYYIPLHAVMAKFRVVVNVSVIFVDEIDSLLCQRTDSEHESARRIKTEFLIQFDGVRTKEDDRIFVIGATNRPQDLDHAMRRRLVRRLYIPLPELAGRINLISNLFKPIENDLNANDLLEIGKLTEGYSGADLNSLSQEAAMGPIRAIPFDQFATVGKDMVRPVNIDDFKAALDHVRPSVTEEDITSFVEWNKLYGAK
ncbi:fidgetin-like protein 1 [Teleopsis dalmanni]|uniref:fidgetin-like protein 1 n=1 Tax=Teleopsis dalmanni TaxID=139649 RepID=UPI0018CFAE3D|nr:fidgetin-like protein 1 [Teleopsis dalmanni]